MKKLLLLALIICSVAAFAQDEGTIVKRERIERDKNIFLGGGISILGGSNLGDYSSGINIEGGFNKRLNRVISIGGSISYLNFKYDESTAQQKFNRGNSATGVPPNIYYDTSIPLNNLTELFVLKLDGGNISIISASVNIKVNFVPIKDNSVVSIYAFAKPFAGIANTSKLTGYASYFVYNANVNDFLPDTSGDGEGSYESDSKFTGGIFLGPGIELFPTKPVSFFLQASFGYTLPINAVSTGSFTQDVSNFTLDNNFPFKAFGFTSINFAAGISFNLD